MHGTGWNTTSGLPDGLAGEVPVDAQPMHLAVIRIWALPTTGTLFSLWQATMHALQPMQVFKSIVIPHWWPLS